MEINDILLDAFGGLFGASIHKKKQSVKKNLLLINMQIYHYLLNSKTIQIFKYLMKNQYIMIIMNLTKLKKKRELIIYY